MGRLLRRPRRRLRPHHSAPFGLEPLLDAIADSAALATFVGDRTRLVWPADHGLRRIPVHDPTPVYPHSLIWHRDNPHPALTALRAHLGSPPAAPGTWTPPWAHHTPSPPRPCEPPKRTTGRRTASTSDM
ncbi:hypothetical protein [Actinomadura montaniterrae]|uniref:hypothetical protein n=1 Tax=Actinomadura montaniterrae TaxID=1803903 RepID=UPI001CEF9750|nr:hypothetical protein [Actinomadura montaniterrae]